MEDEKSESVKKFKASGGHWTDRVSLNFKIEEPLLLVVQRMVGQDRVEATQGDRLSSHLESSLPNASS